MSKREVPLPHVDPNVTDPRAAKYRSSLEARKFKPPVAGGPMPPVPNLQREPPTEGPPIPMSAHAMKERAAAAVADIPGLLSGNPDSIISQPPSPSPFGPPGILPMDILPEQAKQDPNFREGAGSMYAVNQAHLAMKYGVIRKGNHIPPQALNPSRESAQHKASDATVKGLEEVARFNEMRRKAEGRSAGDLRVEEEAEKGPAAAAARIGNAPGDDSVKPLTPAERKELSDSVVKKMDDFDFDTFRQMMMKDLLNNPEQRDIIEERLKPLDIADMVVNGSVTQEVPIIPDKFFVRFRSVRGKHDLHVKKMLMEEAKTIQIDDRYYLDKFAFMTLTMGLEAINNNVLPDYLDDDGKFNEEKFWKKYEIVTNLNIHMLGSLGVNYFWFDIRVRKLFVAEKVKNG